MKEETFLEKLLRKLLRPYEWVTYFFAIKWLNANFGEREYWGDFISELLSERYRAKNSQPDIKL